MPVPNGDVAETPAQARAIAEKLGGKVVVKAQVHAGGRGKAGGVKLADDAAGAEAAAEQILGMMLKTPQTPPEGIKVLKVLVEEASPIATELYLSMTLDRGRGTHVVMASQAGGMEIEEVAATHPEKIIREWTDPALGLQAFQARNLAFGLGLKGDQFKAGVALILNLFRAYSTRTARWPRSTRSWSPRTAASWRSTPSSTSTTTRSTATRRSWRCATSTKRPRSTSRRRSTASTTSSWTGTWAAW